MLQSNGLAPLSASQWPLGTSVPKDRLTEAVERARAAERIAMAARGERAEDRLTEAVERARAAERIAMAARSERAERSTGRCCSRTGSRR